MTLIRLARHALVFWLLTAATGRASSPGEAVALAYADAARLPPAARGSCRYLYFPPGSDVLAWRKVADFWLNSLSPEPKFSYAVPVRPWLLRVDLYRLGLDMGVWERLGEADPYFHLRQKAVADTLVEQVWPGGTDAAGKFYAAGVYKVRKKAGQTFAAHDPAPDAETVKNLRYLVYSEAPVLRGDWFVDVTSQQDGSAVGYYDFLGVKSRDDFFRAVGFDRRLAERVKREVHAVVRRSSVTLKPRQLRRYGAVAGSLWVSLDTSRGTGRANPLAFLDGRFEHEAEEYFAFRANGLFAYYLSNARGQQQNTAPPTIASDGTAPDTDRQVHVGRSCVRCHLEGIRPVEDWARATYSVTREGGIGLGSQKKAEQLRLEQLYLDELAEWVAEDQQRYARAVFRLTGLKPAEMARAYARAADGYRYADLTLAQLAREAGHTEAQARAALTAVLHNAPPLHPVLAGLIARTPQPARREHAEEVFSLFLAHLRGYAPPRARR